VDRFSSDFEKDLPQLDSRDWHPKIVVSAPFLKLKDLRYPLVLVLYGLRSCMRTSKTMLTLRRPWNGVRECLRLDSGMNCGRTVEVMELVVGVGLGLICFILVFAQNEVLPPQTRSFTEGLPVILQWVLGREVSSLPGMSFTEGMLPSPQPVHFTKHLSILCSCRHYGRPAYQMRTLYFRPVVSSFFSLFCVPRLISAVADWMSTILPHMVWP